MSETLRRVQSLVLGGDYLVSRHGFREFANDDILADDVIAGVKAAVLVEDYAESRKEPSVLTLQSDRIGPIHVIWGILDATGRPAILVTAISTRSATMVRGLHAAEATMTRVSKEFIHEGPYCAEIQVELVDDDTAWSPYLSPAEVRKLDALRRGDLAEAAKYGRVFELTPVAAE